MTPSLTSLSYEENKSFEFIQMSKQSLQYDHSMGDIGDREYENNHLIYDGVRH